VRALVYPGARSLTWINQEHERVLKSDVHYRFVIDIRFGRAPVQLQLP